MPFSDVPLLDVLRHQKASRMPIWFMRQAGRYLPEYRELRQRAKNFIDFCLTPELAAQATLQPLHRFDLDAAIVFADILLLPLALGQSVAFIENEGPHLSPLEEEDQIHTLVFDPRKLEPVCQTLREVKKKMPKGKALIGFAGGPWTVACYMIDGGGKTGFEKSKKLIQINPEWVSAVIESLIEPTISYLSAQIDAGADVIQIFESHAGLLTDTLFDRFVTKPTRKIIQALKEKHPLTPIIGFPRGVGEAEYQSFTNQTGVDAVGLDQNISLDFAERALKPCVVLQGNLDPETLVRGGEEMEKAARAIVQKLGPSHIFNLGHGILPHTPLENVARLIEIART